MGFDRVSRLASIPALVTGALLFLGSALPATALSLLRDADIEHGLKELAFPVLRAAGLNPNRVRILVVNDSSLNAFVVDHNAIFLHYGLILKVDKPGMLQAVIAHEAAHIANGHIQRRIGNLRSANRLSALGTALAIAAAAAGAGEAAGGIALGTQSSALRGFLKHTRAEESSADQAAAGYLRRSGISPRGLMELHQLFAGQVMLSESRQDPYMQSHPLTRDRIRAAEAYVAAHDRGFEPDANAEYWFARVQGKLSAFLRSSKWTMGRLKRESHDDIRHMRSAVAYHRDHSFAQARSAIDAAIALRPGDPYYHDLKGQILMENRRWSEAVAAYGTAVDLGPGESLILAGHGRALLANGKPRLALPVLEQARARDYRDARLMHDLAVAYSETGNPGMASVVTAERYALLGRLEDAGIHARRAIGLLPAGSAGWQRAQDVLIASERAEKRKR